MARNLNYNSHSFRLNENIVTQLKDMKEESGLSYNLIFVGMLEKFNLKKYVEKRKQIRAKRKQSLPNMSEEDNL